jgi:hypothetical protein
MTITTGLRKANEQAGNEPIRIEDPVTQAPHVLPKADVDKTA